MKRIALVLLVLGVSLLLVNIYGSFKNMRNDDLYSEELTLRNRIDDVIIKYPEINELLKRKPNESEKDFAVRVNKIVNDGVAHYWKDAGVEKYHLRVPIWENYFLYFASYINPKSYKKYEFSDYQKNLERGVGLCSAHSIIVKGVLNENDIKAELLDVGGRHVVVRAEFSDKGAYLLDPDYGISVPHDTTAVSSNPELVREAYKNLHKQYYEDAVDPYTTDFIVKIYGDKKHVYNVDNKFEHFSYKIKWILPILLLIPFIIIKFKEKA